MKNLNILYYAVYRFGDCVKQSIIIVKSNILIFFRLYFFIIQYIPLYWTIFINSLIYIKKLAKTNKPFSLIIHVNSLPPCIAIWLFGNA